MKLRLLLLLVITLGVGPAHAGLKPIGTKVGDFKMTDSLGTDRSLADFADKKAVVLVFLATECPLAKLYGRRLGELAQRYEDKGVAFLGISSNVSDNVTELKHFAREHQINFPILKDLNHALANALGTERVPTVFLLDQDRAIQYAGRIDDQYGIREGEGGRRLSYQLPAPRRKDLELAIDELLAGKDIAVATTEPTGCLIGRAKEAKADATVTYAQHIAGIFNQHCVYCHRAGQIGPFTLDNYENAAGWAEMIGEVVSERRMPPWHADPNHGQFANDARLSDEEISLIQRWVAEGAPPGDLAEVPEPAKFAEGWLIPEPDEVIHMAKTPFKVKAEGTVPYKMFIVDPGWKEDKWVKAMEPRPGNPSVVHHIVMYVIPPPGKAKYYTKGLPMTQLDWFASFAPGLRPPVLPDHMGRYIPAGAKLVFQMHYTPDGTEQEDLSYVGIKYADPAKVKKEVAVQHAGNMGFVIPPRVNNHKLESHYKFTKDSLLLTVSPHMHWRGKDFKYTLKYPSGEEEVILSVPQYDFGWQTTYILKEPKRVPKGTIMHCVAHFDNSADNLNNPDPDKAVTFGEQTWDEMMYGWFEIALDGEELNLAAPQGSASR